MYIHVPVILRRQLRQITSNVKCKAMKRMLGTELIFFTEKANSQGSATGGLGRYVALRVAKYPLRVKFVLSLGLGLHT